jgi:excisionase family DNA binding protein
MSAANDPIDEVAAPESPVLTVDELAALLRVNRKTVYEALSRGEIPGARRVGSTYRILRAAVIDWLASGQGRVSHSKRLR